jgi:hypothetical protein
MKKLISMLIVAAFATVSMPLTAQDYGDKPRAEKKVKKAKKAKKSKKARSVRAM